MASAEPPIAPGCDAFSDAAAATVLRPARGDAAASASWRPGDVILIAGPTGTGKSALSLELAERLAAAGHPAEIVNGDAYQLYRGMDVGTAKLAPAERRGIPHHLLDVLAVTEVSTVADYQERARRVIAELRGRRVTPILVGGSGLYLSAVLQQLEFPGTDPAVRAALEAEAAAAAAGDDPAALWRRLDLRDPAAAAAIDPANTRRVVRALEVIELTGRPYSASLPEAGATWVPAVQCFLDGDRDELRRRLRARAEGMFADGLLDEVRALLPLGLREGPTASRAIGYAQVIAVLDGAMPLEQAVDETAALTIRYARRQRSWFNRTPALHRLDYQAVDLVEQVLGLLGG